MGIISQEEDFLVLGLNYKTAPLDLRERFTVGKDQLSVRLDQLLHYVEQGVVLSTCNRLEVYTYGPRDMGLAEGVAAFLSDYSGVASSHLVPYLYDRRQADCVRHLFRVVSGLDSMVPGETQILGQVRTAYSTASQEGCVRSPLSRLFDRALRVGRRVHHETRIAGNCSSVSQAGVQLAKRILGDLSGKRALVIGVGETGRLVARGLVDAGVGETVVTNRTYQRAVDLAQMLDGIAVPLEELSHQLIHADVVISSTGSSGYVLRPAEIREVMSLREGRFLLMIDIAVPRDIDPAVGQIDQVRLYDIDDLQRVVESESASKEGEIARAESIVLRETGEFLKWRDTLDGASLIADIMGQAEQIRSAEVAKTLGKLDGKHSDEVLQHLETLTCALVKKLLHHPILHIKGQRDSNVLQLTRELFNVSGGEGSHVSK